MPELISKADAALSAALIANFADCAQDAALSTALRAELRSVALCTPACGRV